MWSCWTRTSASCRPTSEVSWSTDETPSRAPSSKAYWGGAPEGFAMHMAIRSTTLPIGGLIFRVLSDPARLELSAADPQYVGPQPARFPTSAKPEVALGGSDAPIR